MLPSRHMAVACDVVPLLAVVAAVAGRAHAGRVEGGLWGLLVVATALPALRRAFARARPDDPPPAWIAVVAAAGALAVALASLTVRRLPGSAPAIVLAWAAAAPSFFAVLRTPRGAPLARPDLIALLLVLAGNLLIRSVELRGIDMRTYFPIPPHLAERPWLLLLPIEIKEAVYRWTPTGLVVLSTLDALLTPKLTFLLLNQLLIGVAFFAGWTALRSRVFAFTLALGVGFGTQFHYTYVNSSCAAQYLIWSYLLLNLLALYRLATDDARRWRALFAGSLVLLALCWEMWLDHAAFLVAGLIAVWLSARRADRPAPGAVRFVGVTLTALVLMYVPVKLLLGGAREHLKPNAEAELIVSYFRALEPGPAAVLAAEDVVTSAVTYNHIALTNYAPPALTGWNAVRAVGRDGVVAQQRGYGAPDLILANYLTTWRFLAGALSLLLYAALARSLRRWIARPTVGEGLIAGALLLVALGSATHLLIKFRFYNVVPLMSYKCTTAVLGATVLLAASLHRLPEWVGRRRAGALVAVGWVVIVYGALARPFLLHDMFAATALDPARIPGPLGPR